VSDTDSCVCRTFREALAEWFEASRRSSVWCGALPAWGHYDDGDAVSQARTSAATASESVSAKPLGTAYVYDGQSGSTLGIG
jgi:hypothetical protein